MSDENETHCNICLEPLLIHPVANFSCGHGMHASCAISYFQQRERDRWKCALCSKRITWISINNRVFRGLRGNGSDEEDILLTQMSTEHERADRKKMSEERIARINRREYLQMQDDVRRGQEEIDALQSQVADLKEKLDLKEAELYASEEQRKQDRNKVKRLKKELRSATRTAAVATGEGDTEPTEAMSSAAPYLATQRRRAREEAVDDGTEVAKKEKKPRVRAYQAAYVQQNFLPTPQRKPKSHQTAFPCRVRGCHHVWNLHNDIYNLLPLTGEDHEWPNQPDFDRRWTDLPWYSVLKEDGTRRWVDTPLRNFFRSVHAHWKQNPTNHNKDNMPICALTANEYSNRQMDEDCIADDQDGDN